MIKRIYTLSLYLFRSVVFSLTGLLFVLLAFAFWFVFFDPRQTTPDVDYYILLNGVFGSGLTFLVTLAVASRANRAVNFPFLVRLPSRIEYLAAVLVTSLFHATVIQTAVAALSLLISGPQATLGQLLEIPPIWTSLNIFAGVLALQASDLVSAGWSRVYVYGSLAVLLYGRGVVDATGKWLAGFFNRLGNQFLSQGWIDLSSAAFRLSNWLADTGTDLISTLLNVVFWPFYAISNAIKQGFFSRTQALAPAIILIYATILFLLAANFLFSKDLYLTE
jgi:hypothetical protein